MSEAKEGKLGTSFRAPPGQYWFLPALKAGEEALRLSPAGALIARVLVPRKPPRLSYWALSCSWSCTKRPEPYLLVSSVMDSVTLS